MAARIVRCVQGQGARDALCGVLTYCKAAFTQLRRCVCGERAARVVCVRSKLRRDAEEKMSGFSLLCFLNCCHTRPHLSLQCRSARTSGPRHLKVKPERGRGGRGRGRAGHARGLVDERAEPRLVTWAPSSLLFFWQSTPPRPVPRRPTPHGWNPVKGFRGLVEGRGRPVESWMMGWLRPKKKKRQARRAAQKTGGRGAPSFSLSPRLSRHSSFFLSSPHPGGYANKPGLDSEGKALSIKQAFWGYTPHATAFHLAYVFFLLLFL